MAKDPYRYFRIEAQELIEGLGEGLLALEKSPSDPELVRRLLRHAHTFKGASRVVKRGDIGDLAHRIEDLLSPHQRGASPVSRDSIDAALALLDEIRERVASLDAAPEREETTETERPHQSIRVAVRELDALLEAALEAHTAASALLGDSERLAQLGAGAREVLPESLAAEIERVQRAVAERVDRVLSELHEVRTLASELRLVSAGSLAADLERAVRDAAQTVNKAVELHVSGASTHIDAHVLAGVREALVHLVRNSVAHGIESRAERAAAAKPSTGRIEIAIERRGHRVSISCRDDGRGLDLESVARIAIARGLVTGEQAGSMDAGALARLLLRGGVSTSRRVTGLAGRGVGLAVVSQAIDELKGEISIFSQRGEGTRFEILVPLSLSSVPALSMQVEDSTVLIPLDSVRQAIRIASGDITRDGDGEKVVVEGKVLPFLPLERALRRPRRPTGERQSAVVIEAGGRQAAIGVDRLGAAATVVVRSIPEHAGVDPVIAGAAFDDAGDPRVVLAPVALVEVAGSPMPLPETPAVPAPPRLLVIDDSLTTRVLEQSILESAGYPVDLAISGEDGLAKARQRRYALFIVDVEMPGIDGFEFITRARSDPELREIPSILVTSRSDPRDKLRGKEVGARAYIVKSEFDQRELLEAVRRLIG